MAIRVCRADFFVGRGRGENGELESEDGVAKKKNKVTKTEG
jgi:hypothetical protein